MKIFKIRVCDKSGQLLDILGSEESMKDQYSNITEVLNEHEISGVTRKTIEVGGHMDLSDKASYEVVIPIECISWITLLDMYGK